MIDPARNIVFETERLIVRPYTPGDFDLFFKLNGDEEVMRYIRPPQSREQTHEFLKKIINDYKERPGTGRWAMLVKAGNRFVGSFAIIPVNNSMRMQLGYALLKEEWGKGYASESVKGGIPYAFQQLGLDEITGITYPENIPSQKVLLKNGFVFEKTFLEEGRELNLYTCRKKN